jgi:hypothetical protein
MIITLDRSTIFNVLLKINRIITELNETETKMNFNKNEIIFV